MIKLSTLQADITTLQVDAIVNAANSSLLGGGGVDGAIHREAGPELLQACRLLRGCNVGQAKATPGFNLPAKWVFHAVGPIWHGGSDHEDEHLASCYRGCLDLAIEHGCETIAFPAISTGIYGFPKTRAVRIAVENVKSWSRQRGEEQHSLAHVIFCCFSAPDVSLYLDLGIPRSSA
jgi:O-acetyl-ADP-ribose deacetylase